MAEGCYVCNGSGIVEDHDGDRPCLGCRTTSHDFTTCDCADCHRALLDLQCELDELERTDPDVRAAAESYDAMVRRITGRNR